MEKHRQHTAIDHQTVTRQEMAQHDALRPFAPENGQPLRFSIGDLVAIRLSDDEIGIRRVIGYYDRKGALYAQGKRYLLDVEAYWFPYSESELTKVTKTEGNYSLEQMP